MGLEDVSSPNHVIGTGTPASCTSAAFIAAVTAGGIITFNCGPDPATITLTQTAKVRNSIQKLVIDGGGKVTLSGGGANRILYTNTCDTSLGSVSGNCLYAPAYPKITVQNITLADGDSTNSTNGPWSDTGGGAISQLGAAGSRLSNRYSCAIAARPTALISAGAPSGYMPSIPTRPKSSDGSESRLTANIRSTSCRSTFGAPAGRAAIARRGAISGLRTPITVLNSLISYNNAIGCCSNPAWSGTPGGGSGGAIYTDGEQYDLNIAGTIMEYNTAKAGGSAIDYVSNDETGHLRVTNSISRNNAYAPNGLAGNPHLTLIQAFSI